MWFGNHKPNSMGNANQNPLSTINITTTLTNSHTHINNTHKPYKHKQSHTKKLTISNPQYTQ